MFLIASVIREILGASRKFSQTVIEMSRRAAILDHLNLAWAIRVA